MILRQGRLGAMIGLPGLAGDHQGLCFILKLAILMSIGFEAFKVGVRRHGETGAQQLGVNLGAKSVEATAGHQVGEVHGTTINLGDHPFGADYGLPISIIGQFNFMKSI